MINGLPEKLKELRMKYHFSQRAVAKKLDISPASVGAYETGERTPSVENLLAFARLYHCSTDYLLGNDNKDAIVIIDTEGLSERQTKALLEIVDSMRDYVKPR